MIMDEENIDFSRFDTPGEKNKWDRGKKEKSRYYGARRAYWEKRYPELAEILNEKDRAYILDFIAGTGVVVRPRSPKSKHEKALLKGKIESFFLAVEAAEMDGETRKQALNTAARDLRLTNETYGRDPGNIYSVGSP